MIENSRVLVTGANGHIGYHLVQALLKKGFPVRATVRDLSDTVKTEPLRKLGVQLVQAEMLNPQEVRMAVQGVQGIFHTATPHLPWAEDPQNQITRPYVEGTLNLLQAAKEFGVKRFVLTSSCAAIGLESPKHSLLTESDWNTLPLTDLVKAKVQMEKSAWTFCEENKIDLISICPTFVIGPGFYRSTPTTLIFEQILKGKMPPIPEGGCHFLDVRDLATAQISAYEAPAAQGRYIIAGEYLTFSDLIQFLKTHDPSLKLPGFQLPVWTLHLFRPLDWLAHKLIKQPRQLTKELIQEFIGKFQRVSTGKLQQAIHWNPRPFTETVQDTFHWIREREQLKIKATQSLWLDKRGFDLTFFHLSGLACLLLILPYFWKGEASVFPIYNFYLVFFGIPHNYLTWATLLPASSRKTFQMEPIYGAAFICLVIAAFIPLTEGTEMNHWVLSLISYLSLWHAYRQHHGICKVYDSIQAKRTGDPTIFKERRFMNLFFGLALNAVLVWAFTHPSIRYLLSADEAYNLIYPIVPWPVFQIYMATTGVFGILAFKQTVWDRWRADKFIPWPQISLMGIAILTYALPYFYLPLSAMPLAVAIGTIFHNIQYFGFVWLFEKHRAEELISINIPLPLHQRWVHQKAWIKYGTTSLIYSIAMVIFYSITPKHLGLTLIYFISVAHYVIDGYIWKRNSNILLTPVLNRIATAS